MDLIYGVVDLIIGDAPFDISTIKSGSKLIIRHCEILDSRGVIFTRARVSLALLHVCIPEEKWGTTGSLEKYIHNKIDCDYKKEKHMQYD